MRKFASILVLSCGGLLSSACGNDNASGNTAGSGGSAGSAGSGGWAAAGGTQSGDAAGVDASDGASAAGGDAGTGVEGSALECEIPDSQLLATVPAGSTLTFSTSTGKAIQVGTSSNLEASAPDSWATADTLPLPAAGVPYSIKVFARTLGENCAAAPFFEERYDVRAAFTGGVEQPGSLGVSKDDASIAGWATGYVSPVAYGTDVDDKWKTPEKALGKAVGDAFDVVGLGNGGQIVLTFDPPITDGAGADLAVFENGFGDEFLELAYVEVSSDGVHFVRFDSAFIGASPISAFGTLDPTLFDGLAGKYEQGYGTPFDLSLLRYRPAVQNGQVNLQAITHVRIVDIIGDGTNKDSFGHPIYDPTPTTGSGGFDLEAVARLH